MDQEFFQLALELFDEFIPEPNAIWVHVPDAMVDDPDQPWNVQFPTPIEYPVQMLFVRTDRDNRELFKYVPDTEVRDGKIEAFMPPQSFKPHPKDFVKWNNTELTINNIDVIAPINETLLYIVGFTV